MTRLLVAGRIHAAGEARLEQLSASGVAVEYFPSGPDDAYAAKIAEADALVIRTQPLTAEIVAKAERLRVVSRHGVGVDSVDIPALSARGIGLTIVGDVNSVSVAEHAMAQLMAGAKRLLIADRSVRTAGEWGWRDRLEARELSGKQLLILGYGRIGQRLARMARGFDMAVSAHDPWLAARGWPKGAAAPAPDLGAALAAADFVSVHAPKGERPLLGAEEIAAMKPGVILANTARGGVVDEAALAAALASGHVAAAGLDVFGTEPPDAASPLLSAPNAILSPHIAGLTDEASERMALQSIRNAFDYIEGTIDPDLVVNRDALHGN